MKDRSQKICRVSVSQRNDDCSFHIVCDFLVLGTLVWRDKT